MNGMNGQCLCGAVRFEAVADDVELGLCHCKMCRRWGGGLPQAGINASVSLTDGEADALSWWRSSAWGERGFCRQCGTSLFWRLVGNENAPWVVLAGAIDDDGALSIKEHIFIDDKAAFYELADDAPRQTGAMFTARVMVGMAEKYGEDALTQAMAQLREHSGESHAAEVEKHIREYRQNS